MAAKPSVFVGDRGNSKKKPLRHRDQKPTTAAEHSAADTDVSFQRLSDQLADTVDGFSEFVEALRRGHARYTDACQRVLGDAGRDQTPVTWVVRDSDGRWCAIDDVLVGMISSPLPVTEDATPADWNFPLGIWASLDHVRIEAPRMYAWLRSAMARIGWTDSATSPPDSAAAATLSVVVPDDIAQTVAVICVPQSTGLVAPPPSTTDDEVLLLPDAVVGRIRQAMAADATVYDTLLDAGSRDDAEKMAYYDVVAGLADPLVLFRRSEWSAFRDRWLPSQFLPEHATSQDIVRLYQAAVRTVLRVPLDRMATPSEVVAAGPFHWLCMSALPTFDPAAPATGICSHLVNVDRNEAWRTVCDSMLWATQALLWWREQSLRPSASDADLPATPRVEGRPGQGAGAADPAVDPGTAAIEQEARRRYAKTMCLAAFGNLLPLFGYDAGIDSGAGAHPSVRALRDHIHTLVTETDAYKRFIKTGVMAVAASDDDDVPARDDDTDATTRDKSVARLFAEEIRMLVETNIHTASLAEPDALTESDRQELRQQTNAALSEFLAVAAASSPPSPPSNNSRVSQDLHVATVWIVKALQVLPTSFDDTRRGIAERERIIAATMLDRIRACNAAGGWFVDAAADAVTTVHREPPLSTWSGLARAFVKTAVHAMTGVPIDGLLRIWDARKSEHLLSHVFWEAAATTVILYAAPPWYVVLSRLMYAESGYQRRVNDAVGGVWTMLRTIFMSGDAAGHDAVADAVRWTCDADPADLSLQVIATGPGADPFLCTVQRSTGRKSCVAAETLAAAHRARQQSTLLGRLGDNVADVVAAATATPAGGPVADMINAGRRGVAVGAAALGTVASTTRAIGALPGTVGSAMNILLARNSNQTAADNLVLQSFQCGSASALRANLNALGVSPTWLESATQTSSRISDGIPSVELNQISYEPLGNGTAATGSGTDVAAMTRNHAATADLFLQHGKTVRDRWNEDTYESGNVRIGYVFADGSVAPVPVGTARTVPPPADAVSAIVVPESRKTLSTDVDLGYVNVDVAKAKVDFPAGSDTFTGIVVDAASGMAVSIDGNTMHVATGVYGVPESTTVHLGRDAETGAVTLRGLDSPDKEALDSNAWLSQVARAADRAYVDGGSVDARLSWLSSVIAVKLQSWTKAELTQAAVEQLAAGNPEAGAVAGLAVELWNRAFNPLSVSQTIEVAGRQVVISPKNAADFVEKALDNVAEYKTAMERNFGPAMTLAVKFKAAWFFSFAPTFLSSHYTTMLKHAARVGARYVLMQMAMNQFRQYFLGDVGVSMRIVAGNALSAISHSLICGAIIGAATRSATFVAVDDRRTWFHRPPTGGALLSSVMTRLNGVASRAALIGPQWATVIAHVAGGRRGEYLEMMEAMTYQNIHQQEVAATRTLIREQVIRNAGVFHAAAAVLSIPMLFSVYAATWATVFTAAIGTAHLIRVLRLYGVSEADFLRQLDNNIVTDGTTGYVRTGLRYFLSISNAFGLGKLAMTGLGYAGYLTAAAYIPSPEIVSLLTFLEPMASAVGINLFAMGLSLRVGSLLTALAHTADVVVFTDATARWAATIARQHTGNLVRFHDNATQIVTDHTAHRIRWDPYRVLWSDFRPSTAVGVLTAGVAASLLLGLGGFTSTAVAAAATATVGPVLGSTYSSFWMSDRTGHRWYDVTRHSFADTADTFVQLALNLIDQCRRHRLDAQTTATRYRVNHRQTNDATSPPGKSSDLLVAEALATIEPPTARAVVREIVARVVALLGGSATRSHRLEFDADLYRDWVVGRETRVRVRRRASVRESTLQTANDLRAWLATVAQRKVDATAAADVGRYAGIPYAPQRATSGVSWPLDPAAGLTLTAYLGGGTNDVVLRCLAADHRSLSVSADGGRREPPSAELSPATVRAAAKVTLRKQAELSPLAARVRRELQRIPVSAKCMALIDRMDARFIGADSGLATAIDEMLDVDADNVDSAIIFGVVRRYQLDQPGEYRLLPEKLYRFILQKPRFTLPLPPPPSTGSSAAASSSVEQPTLPATDWSLDGVPVRFDDDTTLRRIWQTAFPPTRTPAAVSPFLSDWFVRAHAPVAVDVRGISPLSASAAATPRLPYLSFVVDNDTHVTVAIPARWIREIRETVPAIQSSSPRDTVGPAVALWHNATQQVAEATAEPTTTQPSSRWRQLGRWLRSQMPGTAGSASSNRIRVG